MVPFTRVPFGVPILDPQPFRHDVSFPHPVHSPLSSCKNEATGHGVHHPSAADAGLRVCGGGGRHLQRAGPLACGSFAWFTCYLLGPERAS